MIVIKGQKYSRKSLEMEINLVASATDALGRVNWSLDSAGETYCRSAHKFMSNHIINLQALLEEDPREKILKDMVWSSVVGSRMDDDTAREILRVLDEAVR